ncbi:MAG: DUF4870 domain-containing protein [Ktedonobacteraceae bacterium]
MAQDPNQQSQYSSGYSGYTAQPGNTSGSQQYSQQGAHQQGSYDDQQSYYQQQQQQQQQQYSSYQPPLSATGGRSAHDPTSTGLNARTEALLSYLLGWVSGLIFFVIERKNRFVRFHAAQSFLFFGSLSIVFFVLRLIGYFVGIIPFLGGLLGFVLNPLLACLTSVVLIAAGLIWVFLMIQSYRGVTVRLPFFSNYADSLVNKFTRKNKSTI